MKKIFFPFLSLLCFSVGRAELSLLVESSIIPASATDLSLAIADIQIYVVNDGSLAVTVPTGDILKISSNVGSVVMVAGCARTKSGAKIKPTPSQLDAVELRPGDVAQICKVRISFHRSEIPDAWNIVYKIDEELTHYYSVWSGVLRFKGKLTDVTSP